ncbi:HAD family phosphatase [Candidatus Peribacteria bacterium]|nr:HAD family phosphatase [Candidatus Peribacteria bacterium]
MNRIYAFKALLFDADGTLYNSTPLHFEAYRRTSRELYGFDFTPELFKLECIEKYKQPTQVLREHGIPCVTEDFRARKAPLYASLATEKLKATEGLINLLEEAAEHKVPCAVVTGAQRHSADVSLDLLGIRKYFAVIITQEDTAFRKPDPHPYLLASEHIGVSPAKCCAFEDTTIGITSAKSAGMFCIGIHHEGNTPMELAETDLMIQDFNDLKFECNGRSIKISATITS